MATTTRPATLVAAATSVVLGIAIIAAGSQCGTSGERTSTGLAGRLPTAILALTADGGTDLDGGLAFDAGVETDGGITSGDGGIGFDGGVGFDGGITSGDGGVAFDGGIEPDGGLVSDGGIESDGGLAFDGGVAADGGGIQPDAGVTADGGSGDGGVTADGGVLLGSCSNADGGLCADLTTTSEHLSDDEIVPALTHICESEGGVFTTQTCSTSNVFGTCTVQSGPFTISVVISSPFDVTTAQMYCARRQGSWSTLQ